MNLNTILLPILMLAVLGACDRLRGAAAPDWGDAAPAAMTPQPRPDATAPPPSRAPSRLAPVGARTAAAFDRTTEAERTAALATPAAGAPLGELVVSLGNPAEPGFWLRSGLVTAQRPGTVRTAAGTSVQVDLLPLAGGGPQLSLAAYRALGIPLTTLPKVTVLGR